MPMVVIDDVKINYIEDGEGFPLVFIHAWPTDHMVWFLQVPIFGQHYRVIAVDLRGLGRSDRPKGPYHLGALAADVKGLLDELGIRKTFLCGLSLGGSVAQQFTVDYPYMVKGSV